MLGLFQQYIHCSAVLREWVTSLTTQLNALKKMAPSIVYNGREQPYRNTLNYKRRKSVASKEFLLFQAPFALTALTAQSHL